MSEAVRVPYLLAHVHRRRCALQGLLGRTAPQALTSLPQVSKALGVHLGTRCRPHCSAGTLSISLAGSQSTAHEELPAVRSSGGKQHVQVHV